jgi:hypothetical protein
MTPDQELQQLQAQLLSMQQERDRVAAAFAASQQEAQASAQEAEIRQQLALLQAEIERMQPSQPPSSTSRQNQLCKAKPDQPPTSFNSSANSRPVRCNSPNSQNDRSQISSIRRSANLAMAINLQANHPPKI